MEGDEGGGKICERVFFNEIVCVAVEVGYVVDDDSGFHFAGGHGGVKAHLRYSALIKVS